MKVAIDTFTLNKSYDFRTLENLREWGDEYIWPRNTIINNEQQYYPSRVVHDCTRLDKSGLTIRAEPTPEHLVEYAQHQPYVSGLLTSRDHGHSQLFGYFEMSAQLPSASGAWPAFWLLPTFKSWPDGIAVLSEIDIMEAVTDVREGYYHVSSHTNESGKLVSTGRSINTGVNLTEEFHTYALAWTHQWLIFYFDGVEVVRKVTPEDMKTEPRHMLLNLAVGGNWGGDVVPEDYPRKSEFKIEYVNCYDLPKDFDMDKPVEVGLPNPGPISPEDRVRYGLDGDSVFMLDKASEPKRKDVVTKRDIGKVTEYLIQLNETN